MTSIALHAENFEIAFMSTDNNMQVGAKNATRGFVDGCFDLMHSGHFNALRQAKSTYIRPTHI